MNKTERNAILLSLFSLIGICGIGHFYLKRYKEGVLFLVVFAIFQTILDRGITYFDEFRPFLDDFIDPTEMGADYGFIVVYTVIQIAIMAFITITRTLVILVNRTDQ